MSSRASQEAYLHVLTLWPRGERTGLFTLCADREASGSQLMAVEWRGVMYGYGQLH